ncbi:MAG: hypothetical protein IJS66_01740, partial [Bacteroidales bacterium]|nr:hypothetical protein [Bacteroidales bacterium]
MAYKIHKLLILTAAALTMSVPALGRKEQTDSLVRLMKAESLQQMEEGGRNIRKAISSTFLHNGTYLISDTAIWNVDGRFIHAWGNVKVIQDETILTSEQLDYIIDEDLAQFRGSLVQLQNKKRNTLRTRHLDYNTRDSVATFLNGAAMRDEKGQIIESQSGTYSSVSKSFTFSDDVNMFSDSVFVKTSYLLYSSNDETATFPNYIDFWKGGNMLSAAGGRYDRGNGVFFFERDVHALSEKQEAWCDSLYYYQGKNDILMLGNAQLQDSTRKTAAVADYIFYEDTISQVTLRKRAAVAMRTEQDSKEDTVYIGADRMVYRSIKRCDISEATVKACETRLKDIQTDAVTEYRQKAAKEAREAAEKANAPQGGRAPRGKKGGVEAPSEGGEVAKGDPKGGEKAPEAGDGKIPKAAGSKSSKSSPGKKG